MEVSDAEYAAWYESCPKYKLKTVVFSATMRLNAGTEIVAWPHKHGELQDILTKDRRMMRSVAKAKLELA